MNCEKFYTVAVLDMLKQNFSLLACYRNLDVYRRKHSNDYDLSSQESCAQ